MCTGQIFKYSQALNIKLLSHQRLVVRSSIFTVFHLKFMLSRRASAQLPVQLSAELAQNIDFCCELLPCKCQRQGLPGSTNLQGGSSEGEFRLHIHCPMKLCDEGFIEYLLDGHLLSLTPGHCNPRVEIIYL